MAVSARGAGGRKKLALTREHDIHFYCCLNWCDWFETSLVPYPRIEAYRARILARPNVRKVMEDEGLV